MIRTKKIVALFIAVAIVCAATVSAYATVITPNSIDLETSPETLFVDVNYGDWFYTYVRFAFVNDLMQGTSHTEFSPNTPTTRAMFVTILWRLMDSPITNDYNRFADVLDGTWYANAVNWAAANGLVFGIIENVFDPHSNITREQMATIIYRYQRFIGNVLPYIVENVTFSDLYDTSPSGKEGVMKVSAQGVMRGHYDGTFAPRDSATRAEVAVVLSRISRI